MKKIAVVLLALVTVAPSCTGVNAEQRQAGTVSRIGSMAARRAAHTATLLPDGRVLVTGGLAEGTNLASSEVFNPETKTFGSAGNMSVARAGHTATLLLNGKVLIAGGYNGNYLASAELYDPAANSFTPVRYHSNTIASSNAWLYRI